MDSDFDIDFEIRQFLSYKEEQLDQLAISLTSNINIISIYNNRMADGNTNCI